MIVKNEESRLVAVAHV